MAKEKGETKNIYQKLKEVRSELKFLHKSEKNKFQNFDYVPEFIYLKTISPLLIENNLTMTFEDTDIAPVIQEKGKEFIIVYQKQAILTDVISEKSLTFKFWTAGQNTDIAKAKGSADTYGVKYFLQKFFMIPTSSKDNLDPESMNNNPKEKYGKNQAGENVDKVNQQQVETLFKLFKEKTSENKELQNNFLKEFDKVMSKLGIKGATTGINFRPRLSSLTPEDYQHLSDYLTKL